MDRIDNQSLPIGFAMELAENSDALLRFSNMDQRQREAAIARARGAHSRQAMRDVVRDLGNGR